MRIFASWTFCVKLILNLFPIELKRTENSNQKFIDVQILLYFKKRLNNSRIRIQDVRTKAEHGERSNRWSTADLESVIRAFSVPQFGANVLDSNSRII